MPKIPEDVVRAVTDAAKIEDVVKDIIGERRQDNPGGLHKAGVNMTCLCPFHDDKNDGNLIIRPSTLSAQATGRNSYRCFVCDAKGGPVQFLMNAEKMSFPDAIRWLGKKYNIPVDDVPVNWTPPPPKPAPPPLQDLEIPKSWVRRTMEIGGDQTLFIYWLKHLPWDDEQRARLQHTLWMYCVGGWRDGRVVFWQIDHNGIPRAAKLMRYLADGHRKKDEHPGWIYNQDGVRQRLEPDKYEIIKPLFGSHLLKRYPKAVVNIVESEKTAIIMANYYDNFDSQIWLACGGLKFLQLDSLQPLIDQGRTIWLWPDKDGRDAWQTVCDKLGYDHCRVYTHFFDTCWREEDGDKADVADIAIRMMRTGDKPRHTGDGQGTTAKSQETVLPLGVNPAPTPDPKPDNVTDEEWQQHLDIMKAIGEWKLERPNDEPFLDPDEMQDPQVRMWRETLRQRYNFNKSKNK